MKTGVVLSLLIAIFLFSGCVTQQYIYKPDELLDLFTNRISTDDLERIEIPYKSTPDMKEYARKVVGNEINPVKKSIRLVEAIISEWKLDVSYDRTADATAEKVFHETKRANCLSFTHLFVSLARAVGIKAHYVDVRHDDLISTSSMMVSSRHICAGVHDGADFFLIDFDPDPRKTYRIYQKIDDIEAIANHYNNVAINRFAVNEENLEDAIRLLDLSLRIKPDFSRALNNRGSLLFLQGYSDAAEQSFRQALKYDPKMPEANSNLSGLMLEKGDAVSALSYAHIAVQSQPNNMHYHYKLALALIYATDYTQAYKEFRWITRRSPEYYQAFHGLAVSAYHIGKYDAAENAIKKAQRLQPESRDLVYLESLIRMKRHEQK
ncbi:tetratricopeptide repeat protein [bacterium]|nr:tetratricopeptide repeat protein [candidate division CSSED10-310 bacterium]